MPGPSFSAGEFLYIAPELFLAFWGLVVLSVDFALLRKQPPKARSGLLGALTLLGVMMAFILAIGPLLPDARLKAGLDDSQTDLLMFYGTLAGDASTIWLNAAVVLLLAFVVGLSMTWVFTDNWGEYFALLQWAAVAMMLLIASEELITLFLTLETMTLCLYLVTSFEKTRRRSAEAGLKYFVYGSVSSALFLFGLSLIYGMTGSTRLDAIRLALESDPSTSSPGGLTANLAGATAVLLVLVGFGFKIAAVPFHMWAPDAYEGAPAPVAAWLASGSKLASFAAMLKVFVVALGPWAHAKSSYFGPGWVGLIALIAAISMTYGNFAALAQPNLKRMLAYSSVAHAGYVLVGVLAAMVASDSAGRRLTEAGGAVLFYLVTYAFTTVGAFALAAWLVRDKGRDEIEDLNGLGSRAPGIAVCIVVLMLSLIGMPPFAGFFGKLYMFMEALKTQGGPRALAWLVALALFNSVVSAFYYVRVLKAMFLRPARQESMKPAPAAVSWSILAATMVAVGFGVYPTALLEPLKAAAIPMLTPPASSPISARAATKMADRAVLDAEIKRYTDQQQKDARLLGRMGGAAGAAPKAKAKSGDQPRTKGE